MNPTEIFQILSTRGKKKTHYVNLDIENTVSDPLVASREAPPPRVLRQHDASSCARPQRFSFPPPSAHPLLRLRRPPFVLFIGTTPSFGACSPWTTPTRRPGVPGAWLNCKPAPAGALAPVRAARRPLRASSSSSSSSAFGFSDHFGVLVLCQRMQGTWRSEGEAGESGAPLGRLAVAEAHLSTSADRP